MEKDGQVGKEEISDELNTDEEALRGGEEEINEALEVEHILKVTFHLQQFWSFYISYFSHMS